MQVKAGCAIEDRTALRPVAPCRVPYSCACAQSCARSERFINRCITQASCKQFIWSRKALATLETGMTFPAHFASLST
jgi:hypothetical protein